MESVNQIEKIERYELNSHNLRKYKVIQLLSCLHLRRLGTYFEVKSFEELKVKFIKAREIS